MVNKFLLLLAPVIFLSSYFTVWQRDMSFPAVSSIITILLALPALIGICKWLGIRLGILLFLSLGIFSYFIEAVGLLTGFPYGEFLYSQNVGVLAFNFLPITLPFAWVPLMIGAVIIASIYKENFLKYCFFSLLWLVSIDVVLDPGAVFLGFWSYSQSGAWYGVPISNYLGWIISGVVGFIIAWLFLRNALSNPPKYASLSYFYSLAFWTGVCFFGQIWGGAIIGGVIILMLFRDYLSKDVFLKTQE